ncbi:hypothetical protein ISS21_01675 [Patescibacteria group bacterium]|nr:hypothetical protein [Patescibacteria group bacterium]
MKKKKQKEDKRYICFGGRVISRHDRDIHFVSAYRVAELYGLNPNECYFANEEEPATYYGLPKDLPKFFPRGDGNYKKP